MQNAIQLVYSIDPRTYWNYCWYCGVELLRHPTRCNHARRFTRDHVCPESKGGGRLGNIVAACRTCNSQKHDLDVEEFRTVFFGGHGGRFWGERYAEQLLMLTYLYPTMLPPPIPLNESTGADDRQEHAMRVAAQMHKPLW